MELLAYPINLSILLGSALFFIIARFIKKASLPLALLGIVCLVLFTVNSFLLGIPYLEIIIALTILAIVVLLILLIRRREEK